MRRAGNPPTVSHGALAALTLLGCSSVPAIASHGDAPPAPTPAVSAVEPREPPPALREHAEDVTDYTLVARLDPHAHTVHGEGTIRFRNTSDVALREVWLHLYLNAFKNERSAFLREPAAGFRGSARVVDWGTIDIRRLAVRHDPPDAGPATDLLPGLDLGSGPPGEADGASDDQTEARVRLPAELPPGAAMTLEVEWDDKLPSVVERTGYAGSFHFVGQWFPKLARLEPNGVWAHFPFHHLAEFYADFGTYDVTLDVPEEFTLGATGPVVESRREAGRLVERHVQADVHDFAWTAWDRFESRQESVDGVDVKVLFPRGYAAVAEAELAVVRFALPYFGSRYGRYPYAGLTVVHPPDDAAEAGGMEYPTLITTGGAWYGAPFTRLLEQVTVHELGHQYFYGLLASNEVLWPFLDEGVNSYAEADALRAMLGPGSAIAAPGLTVSDEAIQAVVGNAAAHDAPVAQPAYAFASGGTYSALVYERTAAVLETVRRVYGADRMERALRTYAATFRFEHPGPEDLLRTIGDVVGGEAAAAVRRALFEKGWVDYAVVEVVSNPTTPARGIFDRPGGERETVRDPAGASSEFDGWALVERRGPLSFPVDIELRLADGTRTRVAWDGHDASVRIPYHGKSRLEAAVVDPDDRVLLDDDRTNNHASAAPASTPGARLSLERLSYWAELLVDCVGP